MSGCCAPYRRGGVATARKKAEDNGRAGGKNIKGKREINVDDKKRKRKETENIDAEKGIDQGQQQTDDPMKILEVPISPPHLETATPEGTR